MFKELGISPPAVRRRRRKAGRPKGGTTKKVAQRAAKRDKRGTYKKTAEEFVLGLMTGGKTLTTAQIGAKWRQAGRGGKPDNALTKLVEQKKVKRRNIQGARGSTYQKV